MHIYIDKEGTSRSFLSGLLGWKARCKPIEVGCRGFAGKSLHRVLGLLGICGLHRRRAIKNILEAAEKASRWLWLRREEAWHSALPGHKSGPDHPRLGRPGEWCLMLRPETPYDPGNITDDVSRCTVAQIFFLRKWPNCIYTRHSHLPM